MNLDQLYTTNRAGRTMEANRFATFNANETEGHDMTETSRATTTRQDASQEATTFNGLRTELEGHCRQLLKPEIALGHFAGPYILSINEAGLSANGWFAGLWSPTMATWFRPVLSDRWIGDGPAFIVNEEHLLRMHGSFEDSRTLAAAIAAHELTHAIQFPGLFGRMPDDTPSHFRDGTWFREEMSRPQSESIPTRTRTEAHGPEFVRLALHVLYRMQAMVGRRLPLSRLHDWSGLDLSPGEAYRDSLGDELKRLEQIPLTVVNKLPLPVGFQELWTRDHESIANVVTD